MKRPLSQVLGKGTYTIDGFLQLTVGRHGNFLNFATDQIGVVLSLYGEWAEPETRLLTTLVNPGDTVLDVGAHIGTETIPLARKVGPSGGVVAFEPQRALHQILSANVALNGLSNVVCMNVAVGESDGFIDIPPQDYSRHGNFGGVSLVGAQTSATEGFNRVPIRSIDSLTESFERCALIKVDVEGMESSVLKGAARLIARTRPFLYCEVTNGPTFNALKEFSLEHRYRLHWHCFPGYNVLNFFGNMDNHIGTAGDVNVVMIPEERSVIFDGPVAERFGDVYVLFKGVLGGGPPDV